MYIYKCIRQTYCIACICTVIDCDGHCCFDKICHVDSCSVQLIIISPAQTDMSQSPVVLVCNTHRESDMKRQRVNETLSVIEWCLDDALPQLVRLHLKK